MKNLVRDPLNRHPLTYRAANTLQEATDDGRGWWEGPEQKQGPGLGAALLRFVLVLLFVLLLLHGALVALGVKS